MKWIVPPEGLIETVPAPIIWIDGIGAIAVEGDVASVYVYANRPSLSGQPVSKEVQAVLQRNVAGVPASILMYSKILQYWMGELDPPPRGFTPKLVE